MPARLAAGGLVLCLLLLSCGLALAATEDEGILVNGDHVEYHDVERIVIAHGHVVITYQDMQLTCQRAVVYLATQDAFLNGQVRIVQESSLLAGDEILYNFQTRKGSILNAHGEAAPWYAAGDRLNKASDSGFIARHGYLTTCDFDSPHSRFQARQIPIIPDE